MGLRKKKNLTAESAAETTNTSEPLLKVETEQNDGSAHPEPSPDKSGKPGGKSKMPKKILAFWVCIGIVNAALATGSIVLLTRPKPAVATAAKPVAPVAVTTTKPADNSNQSADVKILHYESKALKLAFDYPVDWRVDSTATDNSIGLTSAKFSFTTASGKQDKGTLYLQISDSTGPYQALNKDDKITADSEKLTYTKPATGQRAFTYVSFLDYGYPDAVPGAFTHVIVSGTNIYKNGQVVGDKNYTGVSPRIYFYIDNCPDECKYAALGQIGPETWKNNETVQKAKAIIASMEYLP
jgi:hypothetical protein